MEYRLILLAKSVVVGLSFFMLLFLVVISVLYSSDGYELSMNGLGALGGLVLGIAVLVLLLFGVYVLEKLLASVKTVGVFLLFALVMCFCGWWISNSANLPQSDQKSIFDIAMRARNHDLLPIAPTGSYMSLWPFQAGLVLFEEVILRFIPGADEMTIQWVYMPLMALSLVSAYMVVRRTFASWRTRALWCILMGLCFPYYFYINNMYGEIPSMAFLFFSLWMLLEYLREKHGSHSIVCLILSGVGMGGAVAVRKNSLIFLIAVCLVLLTLFLANKSRDKKKKYLLAVAILILTTIGGGGYRGFSMKRVPITLWGRESLQFLILPWGCSGMREPMQGAGMDIIRSCIWTAAMTQRWRLRLAGNP